MTQEELLDKIGCSPSVREHIIKGTSKPKKTKGYCYISGGMRGYENYNFPNFDKARNKFRKKGYEVLSPADIDRADTNTSLYSNQLPFIYRDFYSLFYIKSMSLITHGKCLIVMLDGWETSVGACAELFLARWLGIEAVDQRDKIVKVNWEKLSNKFNEYLEGKI